MNNSKMQEDRLWQLNDKLANPDKDTLEHGGY